MLSRSNHTIKKLIIQKATVYWLDSTYPPKMFFFWQISIVIIFRGCLDGACGLVFSLKRCDSVTLVSFKVMCWITVCVYNLKFTTDWLKSPFIKSSNDFTYCVEGLVSWHLMSEYEVGEHTGGAPGHPHLAVHQHLACGRWCHFIFDFKKGTHPLQPGPRLWTGRPLENAEKCFAGAHPAVSTPCTWCRRESNKPVFSGWLNFYFEITWLVFTVPFLFPSAVLRTWVTPSRFR